MGGGQSKTEINQLSQTLNDVIVSTIQSCEVAATQSQTLNETNTGIWLWSSSKLEQQSDISSQCFSDSSKEIQLQNNIISTISQAASTKGVALLDAFAVPNSSAISNLTNIVKNSITMNNIQKSYSTMKQTQTASFSNSGIIGYRSQELVQGSKLFAAATLNELDKAGVFSTIQNKIDQTASTTSENPLEFLSRLVGNITSGIASGITGTILFFAGIIVFVIMLLYFIVGGSPEPQTVYAQEPVQATSQEQATLEGLPADDQTSSEVMPTGIETTPAVEQPSKVEKLLQTAAQVAEVAKTKK